VHGKTTSAVLVLLGICLCDPVIGAWTGRVIPGMTSGVTATARRSLVAVVAAYALALQAVLASFALLAVGGPSAHELCMPAGDHGQSLPPAGTTCLFCPLACGAQGFTGLAPAEFRFVAPAAAAPRQACDVAAAALGMAPRLLPPARAPPGA